MSNVYTQMYDNMNYQMYDSLPAPILTIADTGESNNIELFAGPTETAMLKVTKDGFYVRGVKVEQDEKEAQAVYKAFHQWLTWATLNRNF